jgi:hypothetical protein
MMRMRRFRAVARSLCKLRCCLSSDCFSCSRRRLLAATAFWMSRFFMEMDIEALSVGCRKLPD